MQHLSDSDTNFNWCTRYSHQRIITGTGGLVNKRTSGDHPNDSIIEIGQNTEKRPWDLRRLAVTQTPVRNHLLMLVWKTLKRRRRRRRRRNKITWPSNRFCRVKPKKGKKLEATIFSFLLFLYIFSFFFFVYSSSPWIVWTQLDRCKKLWNTKTTVIPVVVSTLGIVLKNLEKRLDEQKIRRRIQTIHTITLVKLARILKRVL